MAESHVTHVRIENVHSTNVYVTGREFALSVTESRLYPELAGGSYVPIARHVGADVYALFCIVPIRKCPTKQAFNHTSNY